MNAANDITLLLDDLAGHWTAPTLEILKGAGIQRISVDTEIETWRTVRKVLRSALRLQQPLRLWDRVSASAVMAQVLHVAALLVAQKIEPDGFTSEFEGRVRHLVGARQTTPAERRLYAEIVRQPRSAGAFTAQRQTGFTPRLRVSATGG